ncbi:unnamed protein product [Brassica napus]|nr:unnamed protein product [Brassica napus]
MSRRARKVAAKLRRARRSGRCRSSWYLPTLETAQPEVGSMCLEEHRDVTVVNRGEFRGPLENLRPKSRPRPVAFITALGSVSR